MARREKDPRNERLQELSLLNFKEEVRRLSSLQAMNHFNHFEKKGLELVKLQASEAEDPLFFLIDNMSPIRSGSSERRYSAYHVDASTGKVVIEDPLCVKKIPRGEYQLSIVQNECKLYAKTNVFRLAHFDKYPIPKRRKNSQEIVEVNDSCFLIFTEVEKLLHRERIFNFDYRKQMSELGSDGNLVKIQVLGVELIKLDDRFFVIDFASGVGGGGFALVYKAYPIDIETGKAIKKAYIVKIMAAERAPSVARTSATAFETEMKALSKECDVIGGKFKSYVLSDFNRERKEVCWYRRSSFLLFTEFMPGKSLFVTSKENLSALYCMALPQRFKFIDELLKSVEELQSSQEGQPAFIHSDLTGNNIVLQMVSRTVGAKNKSMVKLIDFGLARELANNKNTIVMNNPASLQVGAAPPEAFRGLLERRSDSYALVPVIAFLLNCENPFKNKDRVYGASSRGTGFDSAINTMSRVSHQQFVVDDALHDLHAPSFFGTLLARYLDRMQELDYQKRVYVTEARTFFQRVYDVISSYSDILSGEKYYSRMGNLILEAYEIDVPSEQKTPKFYEKLVVNYHDNHGNFYETVERSREKQRNVARFPAMTTTSHLSRSFSVLDERDKPTIPPSTLSRSFSLPGKGSAVAPFRLPPSSPVSREDNNNQSTAVAPFKLPPPFPVSREDDNSGSTVVPPFKLPVSFSDSGKSTAVPSLSLSRSPSPTSGMGLFSLKNGNGQSSTVSGEDKVSDEKSEKTNEDEGILHSF